MTDQPKPCRTTQHCAVHGFCHRCTPSLDGAVRHLVMAIDAAGITTGSGRVYAQLAATVRDAARTAAARQTTGQDDTESCVDCEHPKKLHNQRGCNGHWGPEEGCTCSHTNTGHTACKGATVCGENDELCDQHEREQAHAEGEHAFCGEECECTCAAAGPEFVPAGHYRDCPHYVAPAVGKPAEAHATEARPPRHRWTVELYDPLAKEWVGGFPEAREDALERLEYARTHTPRWADDGKPVDRRLVRETTTWTVEDER